MRAWAYQDPSFMCAFWFVTWIATGVIWSLDDVPRFSFDWWGYFIAGLVFLHSAGTWYRRTGGPQ